MQPPHPDYVADLEYHHEMYPDEIPKPPATLKDRLTSAVSKTREILGGIKDARDELYGLNGKEGFGLHLKPVDEMEFLPGGFGGSAPDMGFATTEPVVNDGKGKTTIVKEIHHHHHHGGSKKKSCVKKKTSTKKREGDMMDPGYIPESLKKLF